MGTVLTSHCHEPEAFVTTRYGDIVARSCNSFRVDTEVATDDGDTLRAISQIQIGDYVLAWNEETNSISFYPVTEAIHHTDEVVVHLTIGGGTLETTPEHPFWSKVKAGSKRKTCQRYS